MREQIHRCLSFMALLAASFQLVSQKADQEDKADKVLADLVSSAGSVGVVAGYSVSGITWISSAGYMNLEENIPVNNNTLVRCASISKPMTAVAIMQLYEHNLLDLDEPIQTYIPEFPVKKEGLITVRHLLTHASGIGAYKSSKERENMKEYKNLDDAMNLFMDRKLLSIPGEDFNYTTYGYVVLGLVIERISGISYSEYMKNNIWLKAGMKDTEIEEFGAEYENKSLLYHRSSKGKVGLAKQTNLSDRIPGGGAQTTVYDMLRFGQALLRNDLIKEETFQQMMQDTEVKKEGNPYGFGWYLYGENPRHGNIIGHSGTQIGASAQLMILPDKDAVVIIMSNTSGIWGDVIKSSIQLWDIALGN